MKYLKIVFKSFNINKKHDFNLETIVIDNDKDKINNTSYYNHVKNLYF